MSAEVRTGRPRSGWETARETGAEGESTLVQVRHAIGSPLRDTYPVGANDREVAVDSGTGEGLGAVLGAIFADEPACRRIVLAVPVDDEAAGARAETAGMRGIVEVDLPEGGPVMLWVAEAPDVAAQSTDIDDLPQT